MRKMELSGFLFFFYFLNSFFYSFFPHQGNQECQGGRGGFKEIQVRAILLSRSARICDKSPTKNSIREFRGEGKGGDCESREGRKKGGHDLWFVFFFFSLATTYKTVS
ncbi:hypothetical protein F4810DRAFT_39038 [Camillea tinctor]|nr:hypothetical protein F4810DRAFT_39038 [Camillea tinctor]